MANWVIAMRFRSSHGQLQKKYIYFSVEVSKGVLFFPEVEDDLNRSIIKDCQKTLTQVSKFTGPQLDCEQPENFIRSK